jgi:nitrite reductase/ring-hydroxylating ferredoxin subunit
MDWNNHRHAPPSGTLLCQVSDVPKQACMELRYGPGEDTFDLLLYNQGTAVCAYVNRCPHFSLPLNARPNPFILLPGGRVMCAYHSAVFRMSDGRCVDGPAQGLGLDPVPVEIVGTKIFLG